jgi:hypothetical protein
VTKYGKVKNPVFFSSSWTRYEITTPRVLCIRLADML